MSIPHTLNPLGATRHEDWYNWSIGYLAANGTVVENTDYLTTDYIPVTPGALSFWATMGPGGAGMIVYNSAFSRINAWGATSTTDVARRDANLPAGAYIRLNVLRTVYFKSKVVQGGVTLFDGALNPPKDL